MSVDPGESFAANLLRVKDFLLMNAAYPRTRELISSLGFKTSVVDISEFGRAKGGMTCMSLIYGATLAAIGSDAARRGA